MVRKVCFGSRKFHIKLCKTRVTRIRILIYLTSDVKRILWNRFVFFRVHKNAATFHVTTEIFFTVTGKKWSFSLFSYVSPQFYSKFQHHNNPNIHSADLKRDTHGLNIILLTTAVDSETHKHTHTRIKMWNFRYQSSKWINFECRSSFPSAGSSFGDLISSFFERTERWHENHFGSF